MLSSTFTESFLKQLAALQIASRRSFLGLRQGSHISPRKGHGIEFSQYRQYQPGDSPRLIDWNTFARTDRLYVKQFHEEEDVLVAFLIDGSKSMEVDGKLSLAADMASALAYVALNQKDSVVGYVMGRVATPTLKSLKLIHRFAQMMNLDEFDPESRYEPSLSRQVKQAVAGLRFPGVAYLISDFLMPLAEIEQALLALRAKNFYCHVVQILGESDINPFPDGGSGEVVDSETGAVLSLDWSDEDQQAYQTKLQAESIKLQQLCSSFGMRYSCFVQSQMQIEKFILSDLLSSGGVL